MRAGDLKFRVTFEKKGTAKWEEVAQRWARIVYQRGDETVIAGRLVGRNTAEITVRGDDVTRTLKTAMRITDQRGTVFTIRSITPWENGAWLTFTCETVAPR